MHAGRGHFDGMHQAALTVGARVHLHAEVIVVALLGRTHLPVAFLLLVLGRARCADQRGVDDRAFSEQ